MAVDYSNMSEEELTAEKPHLLRLRKRSGRRRGCGVHTRVDLRLHPSSVCFASNAGFADSMLEYNGYSIEVGFDTSPYPLLDEFRRRRDAASIVTTLSSDMLVDALREHYDELSSISAVVVTKALSCGHEDESPLPDLAAYMLPVGRIWNLDGCRVGFSADDAQSHMGTDICCTQRMASVRQLWAAATADEAYEIPDTLSPTGKIAELGRLSGADASVDAYYAGVPIRDLLA